MKVITKLWLLVLIGAGHVPAYSDDSLRPGVPDHWITEQPADVAWPTREWERSRLTDYEMQAWLDGMVESIFAPDHADSDRTPRALVVIQGGKIIAERYDTDNDCDATAWTGSIAKMNAAIMAGLLAREGKLRLDDPAPIPEWYKRAKDPRQAIKYRHILDFTDGLEWDNPYAEMTFVSMFQSNFMEMAFGEGALDSAQYTVERPLSHPPGSFYRYNDGLPSVMGYLFNDHMGFDAAQAAAYYQREVLDVTGMANSELEFDAAGNWYGASGMRWSACDMARFGLLIMRDGVWDGKRILPEGWVREMTIPSAASLSAARTLSGTALTYVSHVGYGLNTRVFGYKGSEGEFVPEVFGHGGYGGSVLLVRPDKDLILVMFGNDPGSGNTVTNDRFWKAHEIVDTLPAPAAM
ncbi:MAG: serine hydrolase [Pseudomonadota bacterium]